MASSGASGWDPSKMFDMSEAELNLVKKRKEMAQQRKQEFRRLVSNPAKQGKGGHILDPNLQRWFSARATYGTYFRPAPKNTLFLFASFLVPFTYFSYKNLLDYVEREYYYRTGENTMQVKVEQIGGRGW